jgi:hypothetical protein
LFALLSALGFSGAGFSLGAFGAGAVFAITGRGSGNGTGSIRFDGSALFGTSM